jgi:hypothetical protein
VLLAQVDTVHGLGNLLDENMQWVSQQGTQRLPTMPPLLQRALDVFKAENRWDEIGLFEKEAFLYGLSGLLLHCAWSSSHSRGSAALAYGVASGTASLAAHLAEQWASYLNLNPSSQHLFKTVAHWGAYAWIYPSVFEAAAAGSVPVVDMKGEV